MKPTEQNTKTPHAATGLFAVLGARFFVRGIGAPKNASRSGMASLTPTLATVVATALVSAGMTAALPATACAYASIEAPPVYSAAPGLPDGRVYQQASPADKNGNQAGASSNPFFLEAYKRYGAATADGNSVLFEGTGPMGESPWGASEFFVASKNPTASGWSTRALIPRAQQSIEEIDGTLGAAAGVDPSSDLSHVMFVSDGRYAPLPFWKCGESGHGESYPLYLAGADPFATATWLERPAPATEDPIEYCGTSEQEAKPVGGTPDFSTVYFTYGGTLLPEDGSRAPHSGTGEVEAWGFYEDSEGVLREAGVLPDGGLDPFGAVPAVSGHGYALSGNQVASDGSRAFFVSPDPASCEQTGGKNDCSADPPELYVREDGAKTQLVSRDTLLPEVGGLPAAAAGGVLQMHQQGYNPEPFHGSYVFASPDGSQAFFQSDEALTKPAEESSPGDEAKMYDFDLNTGSLTYLPNVDGEIVATDEDGSALAFLRPKAGMSPQELDLWAAGPNGGTISPITQVPHEAVDVYGIRYEGVTEARMSSDGSVLVFAAIGLPGYNDGAYQQIFRYDARTNSLGCVSCAPAGVTPTGSASMSVFEPGTASNVPILEASLESGRTVQTRGISANGDRVFFDTPTPLVPQDTNTDSPEVEVTQEAYEKQGRDVYEWENGVVYLISGGKGPRDSYFLDNSENGDDVFFATTEGLVPGDTDGAYDVYDARVPHPGEPLPPAAVPCEGSVCQGPPSVPSPLAAPASATFSGLGNSAPEPNATPTSPKHAAPSAIKCKKRHVKRKGKCVKGKRTQTAKKASHDRRVK